MDFSDTLNDLGYLLVPSASSRETIASSLSHAVLAIIDVGKLLLGAKAALSHGGFEAMVDSDKVPFGVRTAQRLMAIAEHSILSNTTHASLLPPAWMTVYELTRAPAQALTLWLTDGTIHPGLERACKPFKPLVGAEGFEPPATKRTAV